MIIIGLAPLSFLKECNILFLAYKIRFTIHIHQLPAEDIVRPKESKDACFSEKQ